MVLYVWLPIVAILTGVLLYKLKYGKQIYCLVWGIVLFVIGAIRKYTGHDYVLYSNWYNELFDHTLDSLTREVRQEKAFIVPLKLMKDHGCDVQVVFVIIALAVSVLLLMFVYKNSNCAYISIAAFIIFGLFFNSINFMRQILAALIVCFAYTYIKENRPFRFLALVLLATVFHISAFIMIPFYLILKIRLNKISLPIFAACTVGAWIYSEPILLFLTRYVYTEYSNVFSNPEMGPGLSPIYAVSLAILFLVFFVLKNHITSEHNKNHMFLTAMFFGLFFEVIGLKHAVISRFSLYFLLPAIVVLSAELFVSAKAYLNNKYSENRKKLHLVSCVIVLLVSVYSAFTYIDILVVDSNGVVPYNTVFSGLSFEEFATIRDRG